MALLFQCPNCGVEIVAKYVKTGEFYKCRKCGEEITIPTTAVITTREPTIDFGPGPALKSPANAGGRVKTGNEGKATAALFFGVISCVIELLAPFTFLSNTHPFAGCVFFQIVALFLSIAGIILGAKGTNSSKRAMAITGIVLSGVAIGEAITVLIFIHVLGDIFVKTAFAP